MDDLIRRQDAIDAIDVLKRNYPSSCFEDLCKAVDIAIKVLSAQPDRKRGHWTSDGNCSECGEHAPFWAMASTYHTTPYCYNCGADMREESDNGVH